jgi:hypothetical protein
VAVFVPQQPGIGHPVRREAWYDNKFIRKEGFKLVAHVRYAVNEEFEPTDIGILDGADLTAQDWIVEGYGEPQAWKKMKRR